MPSYSAVNPRLRGPLGPGKGTDDFLGFVRTRDRVSTPQGSSPIALIQKGDWCGSEFIRHLRNENRRRVRGDNAALRGMIKNVFGHEGLCRAGTGVS